MAEKTSAYPVTATEIANNSYIDISQYIITRSLAISKMLGSVLKALML